MNRILSIAVTLVMFSTASYAADDAQLDAQTQQKVVETVKEYCGLMQEFAADVEKIDNMETIYAMCENNNVSVFNDLTTGSTKDISDNAMPLQQYMMMLTDKFENNVKTSYSGYKYLKAVVQPSPLEDFDAATYAFVKVDKQVKAPGINATHHLNIIVNTATMKVSSTTSENFEDPQGIYLQALELYNSKNYKKAIPLFERVSVLQRFPGRYRAKSMLGWIYTDQSNFEKAYEQLREASEEDPLGKVLLASKILLSNQVPVTLRNSTQGIRILRALGEVRDKEIPQMHLIAKAALYDAQIDLKTMQPKLNLPQIVFEKLTNDLISDPQSTEIFKIRGYIGKAYLESENPDESKAALENIGKAEALWDKIKSPQKMLWGIDAQIIVLKWSLYKKTQGPQFVLRYAKKMKDNPYAAPIVAMVLLQDREIDGALLLDLFRKGAELDDPFSTYIVSLSHYPSNPSGMMSDYENNWFGELLYAMDNSRLKGWMNFCLFLIADKGQKRSAEEFMKWNQKAIDLGDLNAIEDRAYFEACNVPPCENVDIAVALERVCKTASANKRRITKIMNIYWGAYDRERIDELNIPFEQTQTYKILKSLDEQGNGAASYLLHEEYSHRQNEELSLYYMERSKDAGCYYGIFDYANYLRKKSDLIQAFKLFNELTVYPKSMAYGRMGLITVEQQNYEAAKRLYHIGREVELDYFCCEGLSDMYFEGHGYDKDMKGAKYYIDDAINFYKLDHFADNDESNPGPTLKRLMDKRSEIERLLADIGNSNPSVKPQQAQVSARPDNQGSTQQLNDEIQMPQFPNGMKSLGQFINENVQYPEDAWEQKIEGRVIVSFVVDIDGTITDVEVEQKVYPSLDAEAARVVKSMPKWKPANNQGLPVRMRYKLPLTFTIPSSEK